MIVQGWKDASMNMKYCPNALRVVGGECGTHTGGGPVCGLNYSTSSGDMAFNPYQLDSVKPDSQLWSDVPTPKPSDVPTPKPSKHHTPKQTPKGYNLNNPCHAPIFARDFFMKQNINPYPGKDNDMSAVITSTGYNSPCYGNDPCGNKTKKTLEYINLSIADISGKDISWKNMKTCNWDGPFCHRAWSGGDTQQNGPTGKVWNGGGNDDQGSPWPCYGYISFLNRLSIPLPVSSKCKSPPYICTVDDCKTLQQLSYEQAKILCDKPQ